MYGHMIKRVCRPLKQNHARHHLVQTVTCTQLTALHFLWEQHQVTVIQNMALGNCFNDAVSNSDGIAPHDTTSEQ
jgi:hypothetical protein